MNILWTWKEIMIAMGGGIIFLHLFQRQWRKIFFQDRFIVILEIIFISLVLFAFGMTLIKEIPLINFFLAIKYDLLGFAIFFIAYHLGQIVEPNTGEKITKRYTIIIKWLLIGGLVRYVIVGLKPGGLKYFGYDRHSFEGKVGEAPPAVYYTQLNQ